MLVEITSPTCCECGYRLQKQSDGTYLHEAWVTYDEKGNPKPPCSNTGIRIHPVLVDAVEVPKT